MGDETTVDRNDPELKYLTVEKNQFNDPATQAEWTQKRLVWVPHESQVSGHTIVRLFVRIAYRTNKKKTPYRKIFCDDRCRCGRRRLGPVKTDKKPEETVKYCRPPSKAI